MPHSLTRRRAVASLAAAAAFPWQAAQAQAIWPDRPIKLIVPFPPGGTSDNVGRIVADGLAAQLGVAVVVDNKPGGTTQLGTEFVARAAPDGLTLLAGAATAFTVLPHLRKKLPYDPKGGFEYLGGIAEYLALLVVRKDLGIHTLPELLQLARAQPGKLTLGSAGLASFGHVAGESLQRETGIKLLHVPYKGSADAVNALAGRQVDIVIDGATVALAKAGRVTPIVAYGDQRHPELPQVPSLTETGVPVRMTNTSGWGLFAPKGTPPAITQRLSTALHKVLDQPEIQARFRRTSTQAAWRTPEELRRALDADYQFYAELLPQIGLRPED
jgi:tripartite-type tricarboxylate transporter receptor subunit TctC